MNRPAPWATTSDFRHAGATLAVFRIGFGVMMVFSVARFWWNGWIEKLYLEPTYFFTYRYFEFVQPLGPYTYGVFLLAGLSALAIALGWRYRLAVLVFLLSFTYAELMDKTNYLNHYYFVSLAAGLLLFLPAANRYSLDARRRGDRPVPGWTVYALRLFVGVVYLYAGLAKLNSDWLLEAQPLATWLPGRYDLPFLGAWLEQRWVAYVFAWAGAAYDLFIPFLLLYRPTRWWAFAGVIVFHVLTRILFPIGMFPFIMIVSALVFFDGTTHAYWLQKLGLGAAARVQEDGTGSGGRGFLYRTNQLVVGVILLLHLLVPWRYLLHEGELFWTESGYRYSWRVMLMEKAGYLQYHLVNPETGDRRTVDPAAYLTAQQTKQLSFQPDFILQFAQHLGEEEYRRTKVRPEVYAECYVALNGRRSRPYVDPAIDLMTVSHDDARVTWLLPFEDDIHGL